VPGEDILNEKIAAEPTFFSQKSWNDLADPFAFLPVL